MDGTAVADVAIRRSLMDTTLSTSDIHNDSYHANFVAVWKNAKIVGHIFVKLILWDFY
jgi:hypothetical protein